MSKISYMIRYVQIFGERCSGTNFVAHLVKNNLDNIELTKDFGGKHWFIKDHYPRSRPNESTDFQCIRPLRDHSDTLFLCLFRNPYDWVRSIREKPYHARNHNGLILREFIRKPWHSFEHARLNRHWPQRDDNFWFIEEAINILHLRSMKIEHLLNLQNQVDNICFVNYEKISEDENILNTIADQFQISLKHTAIKSVSKHFGRAHDIEFSPSNYPDISPEDLKFINEELNWDLENHIGYHREESDSNQTKILV